MSVAFQAGETGVTRRGRWISWLRSVVDLGLSPDADDAEIRRIRVLNLTALIAFVFNTSWTVAYLVVDRVAFQPVIVPNLVASLAYLAVLVLNGSGRRRIAIWLLFGSSAFNLTTAGLFFGLGGGVWLFLLLVPALGALFVPSRDVVGYSVFIVGGSILFGVVGSIAGDVPEVIAGTGFASTLFLFSAVATALTASVLGFYHRRLAERAEARSEALLLNILPTTIARRLKAGEYPIADRISDVSVLFADIVGSTELADRLPADDLVQLLDEVFSSFDDIAESCGLEKIKTSGDAYIAVAGIDPDLPDPAAAVAEAALSMRDDLRRRTSIGSEPLRMRFGIHCGPVVAGVIGKRKFSYDVWGDTMNTASRMESTGRPGEIQVSAELRRRLDGRFDLTPRGRVAVKGKGELDTYWLLGRNGDAERR